MNFLLNAAAFGALLLDELFGWLAGSAPVEVPGPPMYADVYEIPL